MSDEVTPDSPPPSPKGAEWVYFTPEMAARYLAKNKVNRDLKRGEVETYLRQMKDGLWGICVEPIVVNTQGQLVNGQHRFSAMVEGDFSFWFLLLEDVPDDTAKTVNGGARSHLSDILKYNGEKNYTILAGAVNTTYLWAHHLLGATTRVTPLEGEKWLEQNPDLRHSAEVARHVASVSVIDIGATTLGAAHWIIAQENGHAEADMFLYRMAHLNKESQGSVLIALMNRLNRASRGERTYRPQMRDQVAALIKCWNLDVEGRFVQRIVIKNKTGWQHPIPLKKDNPITEEQLHEMVDLLPPPVEEVLPDDPDMIVDEGIEE